MLRAVFILLFSFLFLPLVCVEARLERRHGQGREHHHRHARRSDLLASGGSGPAPTANADSDGNRTGNATLWTGDDTSQLVKRDGTKYVFMHHIVGNTYPYTPTDWEKDLLQIHAKGIDAIALNIGSSPWQLHQLHTAYTVASSLSSRLHLNPPLHLFLSFDFTEMECDVGFVVRYTNMFKSYPVQFRVGGPGGRAMVSSYGGGCLGNEGWRRVKAETGAFVMPFVWGIEGQFKQWDSLDSWYCWGCAWPQGNWDKSVSDDEYYFSQLGSRYATTVSMWMFTHLPSKNFYLRGDNWLINNRWEQLVGMRDRLTFIEMLTWNDYGESDYFGPIRGAQPAGTYWADGFPHTAWFDMSEYYIKAFKTGVYPAITKDVIYYWSRPHPARADVTRPVLGKPSGWDWAEDFLWAAVFATHPATVTLRLGSSSGTFQVPLGVSKLKIPTAPGRIGVKMERGGVVLVDKTDGGFEFVERPARYNYNAYVGAATATTTGPTPTTTTSSLPAPSSSTIDGVTWKYEGCYHDNSASRTLPDGLFISDSKGNTREGCLRRCSRGGYRYGGVEYGMECFCSRGMREGVRRAEGEGECGVRCSGDGSQMCGAAGRINVFSRPSLTTPGFPPATTTVSGKTWRYVGCYTDTTGARTLWDGGYFVDGVGNSVRGVWNGVGGWGGGMGVLSMGRSVFVGVGYATRRV
ncbi:SEC14 cytosolic factor [Coprinopsis cinerea AmutBmut pab1-1]|nr:SEC14 cytosolic factor [Coprinopsis cinerea AmutBmut pab1-1]